MVGRTHPMTSPALSLDARVLVRSGLVLWLVAGFATVWEVLAMQGPDSPLRVGIVVGPITQLRGFAFALGAVCFVAAWLWPALYAPGKGRITLAALVAGSALHVAALLYAASQGMVAVQAFDPRPDAPLLFIARALGHALCLLALASTTVQAFKRR